LLLKVQRTHLLGKTEICQTFSGEKNSEEYKATVTDEFMVSTQMMGDKYMIKIVDSSGQVSFLNNQTLTKEVYDWEIKLHVAEHNELKGQYKLRSRIGIIK
jgi:hypothetical protein